MRDAAHHVARAHAPVWLFDLDNTLHDASNGAFGMIDRAMNDYIVRELAVDEAQANHLRGHYWHRYGATMLGLMRHHGVAAPHFLHHTHLLPGLEPTLRTHPHDVAALRRLRGRKYILTNAPLAYAERVLAALGLTRIFDGVIAIRPHDPVRPVAAQARCAHVPGPGRAPESAAAALRAGRGHAGASEVGAACRACARCGCSGGCAPRFTARVAGVALCESPCMCVPESAGFRPWADCSEIELSPVLMSIESPRHR